MIPVLIVPVLSGRRVHDMLASVDVPVGLRLIIANGADIDETDAHVIRLPRNIGVAAAWNLGIKATCRAPWWAIVNDDVIFAPGDLGRLVAAMADPAPRVVTLDGFAAFGVNQATLARVGWFDENFHPAYVEDCDYEYRCRLFDVPIVELPAGLRHDRSATIRQAHYATENARTYPANREYYRHKWGGEIRGGERFESPFGAGGSPAEWTLNHGRLTWLSWREPGETTALMPVGDELR